MINVKKIYNALLNNSSITSLIPEENILNSYPAEVEVYPCIIFLDENQSDTEYSENKPRAGDCSVQIHIFSKKIDGYISTSDVAVVIAEIMNNDLWNTSQNGEVTDPDPNTEHRVMRFNKSIYNN